MRKLFAIFFLIHSSLSAFGIELNTSYDYFRSLPDGSWNGNAGAYISANSGVNLNLLSVQLGASYGLYNWDGRENIAFKNNKKTLQQGFATAGISTTFADFNVGLAYDCQFTRNYSIYALNPTFDQFRFQTGKSFCNEEIGLWGTFYLSTCRKTSLGVPVRFRAVSQLNVFWSHYFDNCALATIWMGAPYQNTLRRHCRPTFTAGFSLRAPLSDNLFIDGHGSYMTASSKNYAANIAIGLTYIFGPCESYTTTYLPLANNSLFIADTNLNN